MKRMQEKIIEHNSANFTGSVKLEEVEIDILGFKNLRCLKVSFEEGARTYWHKHPSGQILVILSGEGRIGNKNENNETIVQKLNPGDIFVTDPGEIHWHGASPNKKMTHIAIQADIEWSNNQVNESEYKKTCLETKK
ncbi:MAG: cupin domain-containing protein [Thermoproteota archaeon]